MGAILQQPSHIWGVSRLFWKWGCGLQITVSNPTPTQSIPLRRPPNLSSSFQPSPSEELSVPLPHSQSPPSSDCALRSLQAVPFKPIFKEKEKKAFPRRSSG